MINQSDIQVSAAQRKRRARVAGLWYLAMALTGPIGILYAPSQVLVPGDAAATAAALIANTLLARVGVAASIICQVTFIGLVLSLQRLFEGVNDGLSRLMHALVIAAVPIAVVNELLVLGAVELVGGSGAGLPASERNVMALGLLNVHELGVNALAGVFWGLWLFPFGLLVIRSAFVPKVLGALLIVGGCAYVLDSSLALLAPLVRARITNLLLLPLAAGELSVVTWLLVKGARDPKPEVRE
jgi:hypothetical protein